jgi:NTP pyrophosphatase (non-canonical NTP hydrolase)
MSSNSASTSTLTGYQFFQGLCQPDDPAAAVMVPMRPSDEVHQKTAALQQILHTLMAADSGWPTDQPQTPATLLPYVTDEAEELLEALPREPQLATAGDVVADGRCVHSPRLMTELCADWLWAIAASTPIAMQLLEGVAANIHDWPQVYGIRLVPMLEIQTQEVTYTLDLTTQSWGSLVPAVAPDASMQLLDLPTAPWVAAATVQTQIRDRSMALVPSLRSWFAGVTVQLCLPDTDWMTAQARLVLPLMPLTMQVTSPEPTLLEMPLSDVAATGLPTARVWQAAPPPATVVETRTAVLDVPAQAYPWTLDSELSFAEPGALATALQALHYQELSQRIVDYARSYRDLTSQALLETVLNATSESEVGGLMLGHAPLALSDLCHQVKWLWIQASQEYMPLMGGLSVQQLQSGRPWQSGTLMSQGQLVLSSDGQAIAALDVATSEWITTPPPLAATDLLHLSTALQHPPVTIWSVERLTTLMNQTVAARSPLLASLMAPQPVQLWSPQDDLFPDLKPPALTLCWQVVLTFLPSFS